MQCLCCSSDETKKAGYFRNRNRRVQRFFCNRCGKYFKEQQPLDGVRLEAKQAAQIVALFCENIGVRAVSRLTGVCQETVLRVLATAGEHCARLLETKVRNVQAEHVEIDELYSFVKTRPDNTEADDEEHGAFYLFLAMERKTKLIINHLIGKRHGYNAGVFLTDLKSRIATRFQLSSDGWAAYTGYWGGGVARVFGDNIDFGTEVKQLGPLIPRNSRLERVPTRFNPVVVKWVKRTPLIGNPVPREINTSRVERLNLTVRTFNRRFVRNTIGYSKTLENHKAAAALFAAHYNFCKVHSAHKQTPAMAAKLTDRVWSVDELISASI